MSDTSLGAGWWQASDGKWYPPEAVPGNRPPPPSVAQVMPPALQSTRFCVTCGNGLVATAAICPRCGTPVARATFSTPGGKSRSTAVVMAVFLSFWSFLYTYSISAWKFWLGFGLSFVALGFVITNDAMSNGNNPGLFFVLIGLGVWIWSIVDRSITPL